MSEILYFPLFYNIIYLLTAVGLPPGGSGTLHIYTQTIHRTIQNKQYIEQQDNFGRVRAVPLLASITLAFALQPRKKYACLRYTQRIVAIPYRSFGRPFGHIFEGLLTLEDVTDT